MELGFDLFSVLIFLVYFFSSVSFSGSRAVAAINAWVVEGIKEIAKRLVLFSCNCYVLARDISFR